MLDKAEPFFLRCIDATNDCLLFSCFGVLMLSLLLFGAGAAVPGVVLAVVLAVQFAVGFGLSAAYSVVAVLNGHNPAEVLERH